MTYLLPWAVLLFQLESLGNANHPGDGYGGCQGPNLSAQLPNTCLWERLRTFPPSYLAARLRRKGSHAYLTLQHHCCFSFPHHPWIKSFTGTLYKLRNCRVLKHVSLYFIVVSKTSWIDYARDTRKFGCPSFGKEQSAHQKYLPRRLAPRLQSDCTYVRH